MTRGDADLRFERVTKTFGAVTALDGVSFGVAAGRVHALLGENGAGKSTLLKVLSGAHVPTGGGLSLGGETRVFRSPAEAIAAGVAVIYQELHLVAELSVEENLLLGHLPATLGVVRSRRLRERARELLGHLDAGIDPGAKVGRLSIGQRQMLEIAKALGRGARVLAFDEPTSSLSAREIERLFDVVRELRRQGCVVLYVTHRLEEVFKIGDAATVLRDGRHVRTFDGLDGVTADDLVRCMVGRDIADVYGGREVDRPVGEPALEIEELCGPGFRGPVSLTVGRGEVVGLFGLVGAGRTELLRVVFGAARAFSGRVRVGGAPAKIASPRAAIRAGVLLCPEDRRKEGIIPVRSVQENINLSARRKVAGLGFVVRERWERDNARARVRDLDIRSASLGQPVKNLSGGNQQKVVLGRWLSETVRVLLLDEPTRGIDVGARSEIYRIIHGLAARGIGVLVVSSDLPEVLGLADRLLVLREGRIAGGFVRGEASEEAVLRLALPERERGGEVA